MKAIKRIGMFDSGLGGLRTLMFLEERFPFLSKVFVADYINNPYGIKPEEEIKKIVVENIKRLEGFDVDLIIIACNTASIYSYDIESVVPILRITDFVIEELKELYDGEKAYLFATNKTVESAFFEKRLKESNINITSIKASSLVPLIESNNINNSVIKEEIKALTNNMYIKEDDLVVIGCTHFNHIMESINNVLGVSKFVNGHIRLEEYLKSLNISNVISNEMTRIISTSSKNNMREVLNEIGYFSMSEYKVLKEQK